MRVDAGIGAGAVQVDRYSVDCCMDRCVGRCSHVIQTKEDAIRLHKELGAKGRKFQVSRPEPAPS